MSTVYRINGSEMSMAPAAFTWNFAIIGTRTDGRALYSSRYKITAEFDVSRPSEAAQWLNAVSSASFNLTCPQRASLTFATLSGVNAEIPADPQLVDVHMEPFTIIFNGVL